MITMLRGFRRAATHFVEGGSGKAMESQICQTAYAGLILVYAADCFLDDP